MSRTVILSPHLDDAVFSCWHPLTQASATVLTVFAGIPPRQTKTLWDLLCGKADSRQLVITRRQENENALKDMPVSTAYLDYLDAQYRTASLSPEVLPAGITKQTKGAPCYLVPLAAGKWYRYPDHVLLRHVGLALLQRGR